MTTGLAELLAVPAGSGVAAVLSAADAMAAKLDDLEYRASFAPPVRAGGYCSCGSVFEVRDSHVTMSAAERVVAVARLAELLGRDPASSLVAAAVTTVLDAINGERERDDHQALMDWNDAHAYCGGDL